MRKVFLAAGIGALLLAVALAAVRSASSADAPKPVVAVVEVKDSINPGVQDFIEYAIHEAHAANAQCLVILLDTPGGLVTAMRGIVQDILNAPIPVVVYVSPSGAQAASAGVFITASADIAAMAPGTNIGAAHPVTSSGGDMPSTMDEKVMNDLLALMRSIGGERGRNVEWLENSVRKSVSITAEEAFKENVVDLVAESLPDLLKKLDGWEVRRQGTVKTLHTAGAEELRIELGWQHALLRAISDPNIAYILLMIGIAGLYFELSQPGAVLPGVVGGISLVLALYALHTLPVNAAGFLFILLAVIFFIVEIKVASYGLLSLAGVLSLVLGSLMLFRVPEGMNQLALSVLIPTVVAVSAFFVAVATLAFRAQVSKPRIGVEALVGMSGEVMKDLTPEGKVFVNGALWNAVARENIPVGAKVEVTAVENLKLHVKRINGR